MPETLIIIPAYNESATIARVVEVLHSELQKWDILVVNDCSYDRTSNLAKSTGKAVVIDLPVNLGIGGAVQTGFHYAERNNYNLAVQFDGDGQHIATEIPKLLEPLLNGQADVVIGSRFLNKEGTYRSSFIRRVGIKVFELVNLLLIKQRITDNTSGFRAYNRRAIQLLCKAYQTDYPEPEAVIFLGKNDIRIKEVPVLMQKRIKGKSSISGLHSAYYMVKVLLAVFMNAMRSKISKGE